MNQEEQMQLQQQVQQLEMLVKQRLTKQALERFGNVKAAHPEKAIQLLAVLGQAIQSGKIEEIDDDQLKEILMKLTPEKKEFNIRRR
jgi:DNA-binding TFAR19-related protein (PDSD5 family)